MYMATSDKKPNKAGNTNQTGGSYKEKQPTEKPSKSKDGEMPVDEDGDGKSDHSVNPTTKKKKA